MKILSIHIFSLSKENPIILSSAFSSSFIPLLQHQNIKYFLNYHSRLIIDPIQKEIHQIKLEKGICNAISFDDKIGVTMICDEEYSKNIVIYFLIKIYNKFKEFLKENEIDLNIIEKDSDFKFEYILNEIEEW